MLLYLLEPLRYNFTFYQYPEDLEFFQLVQLFPDGVSPLVTPILLVQLQGLLYTQR